MSDAGINWVDVDVISDAGINWADVDVSPAGPSRLAEEAVISLEAKQLPLIPNMCSWQWSVMGQWHSQQQAGVQKPGKHD